MAYSYGRQQSGARTSRPRNGIVPLNIDQAYLTKLSKRLYGMDETLKDTLTKQAEKQMTLEKCKVRQQELRRHFEEENALLKNEIEQLQATGKQIKDYKNQEIQTDKVTVKQIRTEIADHYVAKNNATRWWNACYSTFEKYGEDIFLAGMGVSVGFVLYNLLTV